MRRLLVVPLFPQFSATTTASVLDAVGAAFRHWRRPPELRFVIDYHGESAHIEALAHSVEQHWQKHGRGDRSAAVVSRHTRTLHPQWRSVSRTVRSDCCATSRTTRHVRHRAAVELSVASWSRAMVAALHRQDAFGIARAGRAQGRRDVSRFCGRLPGDTARRSPWKDARHFSHAGGESFHYIPCLNDTDDQVASMQALVSRHCLGWPDFDVPTAPGGLPAA